MGSHSGKSIGRIIGKQLEHLLTLCNIAALGWLYACCLTTFVPCDIHPRLSLITISFPIALLLNVSFIAVWLFVKRKRLWLPIVGTLLCWSYIADYMPLNPTVEDTAKGLKVVSWNTRYTGGSEGWEGFKEYIRNLDADIICMQETDMGRYDKEDFRKELEGMGYEYHEERALVLLTRLHILQTDTISYESRTNGSRWYLLKSETDTILVINNHLESNHITNEIKEEYVDVLDNPGYQRAKQSGRSILSLMAQSAHYRGKQTKVLCEFLKEHQGQHIILCGDLNDTPISYAYQNFSRRLESAFRDSGNGIGVSYNQKGFWVRIDHIFFSQEGTSHHTFIDSSVDISDHYPIVSWIDFN